MQRQLHDIIQKKDNIGNRVSNWEDHKKDG